MPTQAQARTQTRGLIDDLDSPPSKSVRQENLRRSVLGDQVNGTNKFFQLNNRRIAAPASVSSLVVISDGVTLAPVVDYSEDDTRGTFTILGAAPAVTLLARYDFLYFLDAELDIHIQKGLQFIGYSDITTVADGLMEPLCHEAGAHAFQALAARNAPLYDAGAGGKTLNKASIKKHWLDLAAAEFENAKESLKNFYQRHGRRDSASYGRFNTGQKEWTPRR